MITLDNGILRIEITLPDEHPNDGVRFDRAGFISEVTLNNAIHFAANEPKNLSHPTSYGRGFCCEFKLDMCNEAQVGERYPKLGVGLIKKEKDEPYLFYEKYDVEHYPVSWKQEKDCIEFITEPVICMGYAVKQKKRISIDGCTMTVEYEMENAGEKPIDTLEYCHNFISIDGMALSPDYILEVPGLRSFEGEIIPTEKDDDFHLKGAGYGFTFEKASIQTLLSTIDLTDISKELPFKWKMSHKGAKAYIEGEESYTPASFVIWSTDHMMCPEFMHRIIINPGEKDNWSRKLTFIEEE